MIAILKLLVFLYKQPLEYGTISIPPSLQSKTELVAEGGNVKLLLQTSGTMHFLKYLLKEYFIDLDMNERDGILRKQADPESILRGLTARETESLLEELRAFAQLDSSHEQRSKFWNALVQLCEHEMNTSQRLVYQSQREAPSAADTERNRVHAQVDADIQGILYGKSSKELREMAEKIEHDLQSTSLKEVEYWEEVLERLKVGFRFFAAKEPLVVVDPGSAKFCVCRKQVAEAQQFVREYFQDLLSAAKMKFPDKFVTQKEENVDIEDSEVKDAVAMVDTFHGPNSNMEFIEPEPLRYVTKRPGEIIISEDEDRYDAYALHYFLDFLDMLLESL